MVGHSSSQGGGKVTDRDDAVEHDADVESKIQKLVGGSGVGKDCDKINRSLYDSNPKRIYLFDKQGQQKH